MTQQKTEISIALPFSACLLLWALPPTGSGSSLKIYCYYQSMKMLQESATSTIASVLPIESHFNMNFSTLVYYYVLLAA